MPHDPFGDAADRRSAEDAAWREIVDNYGDRPLLEDVPVDRPDDSVEQVTDAVADAGAVARSRRRTSLPAIEPELRAQPRPARGPAEEHYVPPPPPPVPRAEPPRLLAWLGLFLAPSIVLVALVAQYPVPSWAGLLLMVWFVGGFVYLVASMRSEPRDEDDDGAVV